MKDRIQDRQTHNGLDLSELLHPAQAFAHPFDVVGDPDLTRGEKRAILASWASDACALEAAPELRETPWGQHVRFDDIMDALRALDRDDSEVLRKARRQMRRRRIFDRSRGSQDTGRSAQ
jgi:hypothetical protein